MREWATTLTMTAGKLRAHRENHSDSDFVYPEESSDIEKLRSTTEHHGWQLLQRVTDAEQDKGGLRSAVAVMDQSCEFTARAFKPVATACETMTERSLTVADRKPFGPQALPQLIADKPAGLR